MKQRVAPVRGLRGAAVVLAVCLVHAVCTKSASAQPAADQGGISGPWSFKKPLHICTASIQDFGARCNGNAGVPSFDKEVAPLGPVPATGWCAAGEDFCGYDIDVWRRVVDIIGLQEGRDYEHICLGENGFGYMIENLARQNTSLPVQCDLGVSSITASVEREATGIQFSRTTHRSALAVMVYAPLKQRGMWAFFEPLHVSVWMALVFTVIVTPFFVFFFESVFSKRLQIWHGITESLWHSVSHTLSIDVFKVHAFPSRLITAAYAFLVLILTNTYTANLAAFLTVDQLDTQISDVTDLRGKAVVTVTPYVDRLYSNHRIVATDKEGWDYDTMIERLKGKVYTAVISDDTQLITRAYSDDSCSLHILSESVEPFDLAFAFSKDFEYKEVQEAVSRAILQLQERGVLEDIKAEHQPPTPSCLGNTEFSETNQVPISSLWGLWVILSVAIGLAGIVGLIDYGLKRRRQPEKVVEMEERAIVFKRALTKSVSFAHAGSMLRGAGSSLRLESSRRSSLEDVEGAMRSGRAGSLRDTTPMGSMHESMACLEVVTESHEEASPKSGAQKSAESQKKRRSSAGGSGEKQRSKAQLEVAAAAAATAAAVAEDKAHTAAATAAAVEASIASSPRQQDKARSVAAAAAAVAAVAAEEASASRAALSARGSGGAAFGSAFSPSGPLRICSGGAPSPRQGSGRSCTAAPPEPSFVSPDYDEATTHHEPGGSRLGTSNSLQALRHPHQQPSFGRSISTVSARSGTTQAPDGEGGTLHLSHSNLQGEESDIGSHVRGANVGPASLAVSATASGTESGGDYTRGSASDCVRSEIHAGYPAPSPPNAPQSPIAAAEDSEAAGAEGFGMEASEGGLMGRALQLLPTGLAGSPLGSPHAGGGVPLLLQLPQHTHIAHTLADDTSHSQARGSDANNTNQLANHNAALDLQLASIRSDGSQLLGMPPSMGALHPRPGHVPGDQNSSNSLRPSNQACTAPPEPGAGRNPDGSGAPGGPEAAQACYGARVSTGDYVHVASAGGHDDMHGVDGEEQSEKEEDIDAELQRLQELVQHVALRVDSLRKRRLRL